MYIRKKVVFTVFILIVLFAILHFLIDWVDEKPVSLSDEGALTYISAADLNSDNVINVSDLCIMKRKLLNE